MTHLRTAYSGLTLPAIGFGTYKVQGSNGVEDLIRALRNGYRLLDSAVNYENEGTVGRAIAASGVDRGEITVTSKLPGRHHAYDEALVTIEESVYRMGLDNIDLYLIHWPNPKTNRYVEAWQALIDAREAGLVAHIGVSNFLPEHLERLQSETGVLPEVNQIELHPSFPQTEALAYHEQRGILTEAWSPLGRGSELLANPTITSIADAVGANPGQVVLAWAVARGAIPLPKASSANRQLENLAALQVSLTPEQIAQITALGRPDGRLNDLDPAIHEEF